MEHYAIIKRMKHEIEPKWCQNMSGQFNPLRYEKMNFYYNMLNFENVIFNHSLNSVIIDYWEGTINQYPMLKNEVIIIEDEKLIIQKLEKNIDGTIIYYVNDIDLKVENYDKLLDNCNVLFDNYNEVLKQEPIEHEEIEVKINWFGKFLNKLK